MVHDQKTDGITQTDGNENRKPYKEIV